jgi:hypothetical protein
LVGEQPGDDARLGEDLAVERDAGDEAARVYLEILGGAWGIEVDGFFFERNLEFIQGDVGSMRPLVGC